MSTEGIIDRYRVGWVLKGLWPWSGFIELVGSQDLVMILLPPSTTIGIRGT